VDRRTSAAGSRKAQAVICWRRELVNLDAMVAQLRAAGISVEIDPEPYQNGRFARLYDPEGNAIELWEPADRDVA
jgi:predicted enzyme related to lactoylglutathione lyase